MDIRMLRYMAQKSGLSLNFVSKDEMMSELLLRLDGVLGEDAVLKGGTALNRLHLAKLGAARFSEDIDLDYFSAEDLGKKISGVRSAMRKVAGFEVGKGMLHHRTLRFDCRYQNALGVMDRVTVEFYLSPGPYVNATRVPVRSPFLDSGPAMFRAYCLEDLLARKLVALYNRMEGKDIYDSYFGLKMDHDGPLLGRSLKMMTEFYRIEGDFVQGLKQRLEGAKGRIGSIRDSTNHYIPRDQRPDWTQMVDSLMDDIRRKGALGMRP